LEIIQYLDMTAERLLFWYLYLILHVHRLRVVEYHLPRVNKSQYSMYSMKYLLNMNHFLVASISWTTDIRNEIGCWYDYCARGKEFVKRFSFYCFLFLWEFWEILFLRLNFWNLISRIKYQIIFKAINNKTRYLISRIFADLFGILIS